MSFSNIVQLNYSYDSDLSSWLSVDPLSDKYPSLSPYAYCANNPVVLVDPNGMEIDDYKLIKRTGEIKLIRETDDKFDRLYAQDGNKFDMDNPLVVKKGILGKSSNGNCLGHFYTSSSESELENVYKFVASKSDVEWSFSSFKNDDKKFSILLTSHKLTSVSGVALKRMMTDTPDLIMTRQSHSHPLNEVTNKGNYTLNMPSGFYSDGTPNPDATHGDRIFYQNFNNNFKGRVPYSFELLVPSQLDQHLEYNDSQIFMVFPTVTTR